MKPEQSVLNKLAKFSAKEVELSAEPMKMELSLVDNAAKIAKELNQYINDINNYASSSLKFVDDLEAASRKMQNYIREFNSFIDSDDGDSLYDRAYSIIATARTQAREMGIDPSKLQWVKELDDLNEKRLTVWGDLSQRDDKLMMAYRNLEAAINELKSIK